MRPFARATSDTSQVLPAVDDMYVYMDANNALCAKDDRFICLATGDTWIRQGSYFDPPLTTASLRGSYFSCRSSIFNRYISGGSIVNTDFQLVNGGAGNQYMSVIALTRVNSSTATWRTLMRGAGNPSANHHVIVQAGSTALGMYDNDTGTGFVPAGNNVQSSWDTDWKVLYWQFSNVAVGIYYQYWDDPQSGSVVGATSGNASLTGGFYALGGYQGGTYGAQFWGDLAVFSCWNRWLTDNERIRAAQILKKRIV